MRKLIILFILLVGCTPTMPIIETLTPLPALATLEPTATFTADEQLFRDTIDYYEEQVTACMEVDADNSLSLYAEDIEKYCTHHAVEEPEMVGYFPWVFQELNWLFEDADAEYFQFQRQAKIGLEYDDEELIESAFKHLENAQGFMQEAEYYYSSYFEYY